MEVDCYLKMVQFTPTNHVIAPPGFILRGGFGILEIFTTFLPNIGEYQKMSHHLSAEPWNCAILW